MTLDDRASHWDRIYAEKRADEVSWFQSEPALSLRLIHDAGLALDAPILDVGAGASLLVDRLLAEGHTRLAVLDISARALEIVRERLAGLQGGSEVWHGLPARDTHGQDGRATPEITPHSRLEAPLGGAAGRVEFFRADVTDFTPPHPFELWHDRAVFHFLTDAADRARYVETLRRSLAPRGHLILSAFAIGGPERCSGLDVVQYDSEKLLRELGPGFELIEETAEDHVTPGGKVQKFACFWLRRSDETMSRC